MSDAPLPADLQAVIAAIMEEVSGEGATRPIAARHENGFRQALIATATAFHAARQREGFDPTAFFQQQEATLPADPKAAAERLLAISALKASLAATVTPSKIQPASPTVTLP